MAGGPKEIASIKEATAPVAKTLALLEKKDVAGARKVWSTYDPLWNGMEVYVSVRSVPVYNELEINWQAKITKAFSDPNVSAEYIIPMAKAMLISWEDALRNAQDGDAISPLLDDVWTIRIARQPLRRIGGEINGGNIAAAKATFAEFKKAWAGITPLIKSRSAEAYNDVENSIKAVDAALAKPGVAAAELTPLVGALNSRFGFGQLLVTSAGRKAELTKKVASKGNVAAAGAVRAVVPSLNASLAAYNAKDYKKATAEADKAKAAVNSATAAGPLKAKALDAALNKALSDYGALAGAAGDAAKVASANRAARDAAEIAVQGLVGQFWNDATAKAVEAAAK